MPQNTDHSLLRLDIQDAIATLSINRPDQLNGVNFALLHQMHQAVQQLIQDQTVAAIVIAGEGKAFVVGADLEFFIRNIESGELWRIVKFTEAGHRLMNLIDECPKPVVAKVDGVALGAGTELALACDRIVASPLASFGFPETGLGIYPGFGGTQRATRALGTGLAKWLIYTGKTLSAKEACQIGLVHHLVAQDQVDQAASDCARGLIHYEPVELSVDHANVARLFQQRNVRDLLALADSEQLSSSLRRAVRPLAKKAPRALQIAEQLINDCSPEDFRSSLQMEIDQVVTIFSTEDARRGLQFRAERRVGQPDFSGR
jgi:enoyl-CoA hydratase/3-hydroxyacyl-CoA dehydrogenase